MTDQSAAPAILPDSWSVKEVVADLKADIHKRLDYQDELLHDIATNVAQKADKTDLVGLSAKLDTKADKTDLVGLTVKRDLQFATIDHALTQHDGRIGTLEQHHDTHTRAWYVIGVIATICAILAGSLLAVFLH